MRIGIDCRLWEQTGVGRYVKNLVSNLLSIDQENQYILFVRSKDVDSVNSQIGQIANCKLQVADIRWHSVSEQMDFPKILNKAKLDLMHFPYFSIPIFYNKPFVVTIHDLIVHHFPTGKASTLVYPLYLVKRHAYKFVISQSASKARSIISPSNATKHEIIKHLKAKDDKIKIIHEGFDSSLDISNKTINDLGKYFLYVGNAYPHKNLQVLIDAFNEFCKVKKDFKLILVGKDDYFYKKLEKNNHFKNVIFYGKASEKQLSNLYVSAEVLIMPSLMEGFGLPVLEAMHLRCLVLASDIPVFKEIAGDTVLYFDPKDKKDLVLKMEELEKRKDYYKEKYIEKAFAKSKEYSWAKAAKETLEVYNGAI